MTNGSATPGLEVQGYCLLFVCLLASVILYNWTLISSLYHNHNHNHNYNHNHNHNHNHTLADNNIMSTPHNTPDVEQSAPTPQNTPDVEQRASGAAKRRKLTREEKTEARRIAKEEAAREKAEVNAALIANTSEFLDPSDMAAFSEFLAKNIAVRKFVTHLLMHRTNQLLADYNNLSDWHDFEPVECAKFINGTFEDQMATYTEHIHNEVMSESEHESPEF